MSTTFVPIEDRVRDMLERLEDTENYKAIPEVQALIDEKYPHEWRHGYSPVDFICNRCSQHVQPKFDTFIGCGAPDCSKQFGAMQAAKEEITEPGLYVCVNYDHAALFLNGELVRIRDFEVDSERASAKAICELILLVGASRLLVGSDQTLSRG